MPKSRSWDENRNVSRNNRQRLTENAADNISRDLAVLGDRTRDLDHPTVER